MSDTSATSDTRAGNTKTARAQSRRYCFTLNNYTCEDYATMLQYFQTKKWLYIIGKEIGEEKTPHLQGYFESKSPVRFSTLKKLNPKVHWEKARAKRNDNLNYCSKDGYFVSTFPLPLKTKLLRQYKSTIWKAWQQEVLDLIESTPDSRSIYWYVDKKGNSGKSFLAKLIDLKYDVIIADGKKDNVFNQIKMWMDANPEQSPRVVILDIPRSSLGYVNYGMIEQGKNGHIYSGKYEGGKCLFEWPHVLIFANEDPDYSKWSEDRFCVRRI